MAKTKKMMDEEQKKKRKVSKNKKKNWRKHTDVADVEEHLEDQRKDDRTGGATEVKTNESLFFVDKKKEKSNSKKSKRNLTKENSDDDDEEVYVSQKQRKRQQLKKEMEKEIEKAKKARNINFKSVWGQEVIAVEVNDYLEPTVKRAKLKPPTVGTGKLKIGAVSIPDPGSSYNPDFDSHQELLGKAHNVEVRKLKAFQKLNDKVKMVSVEELKKQSELWLKEMSQGILTGDNDKISDEDSSSGEDDDENTGSIGKPKTLQQKRNARLRKEQNREINEEKLLKRRLNDVFRLRKIKSDIRKAEMESAKRQNVKSKIDDEKEKFKVKRLSKHKYRDEDITFQLSEDLCGSYRELKPEGSLLTERFKSLQRRNIIETRRPVVPHRKYKRKVFSKRSYKVPTIKDFEGAKKK